MRRLSKAGLTAMLLIGLIAGSNVALAETEDVEVVDTDDPIEALEVVDTLFTFGYDMMTRIFHWNISSLDDPPECALDGMGDDCPLTSGEVSGPNGQVNHGMFMKLFNSLYQGPGRGCVVRHLAQSDLGTGDQQVRAGESVDPVEPAEVEFTAILTECNHGNQGAAGDELTDDGDRGKPDTAGKPDHAGQSDHSGRPDSPGNSGSAPGKNKEKDRP